MIVTAVEISADRRRLICSDAVSTRELPATLLWRHGTSARARRRRLTDPMAAPPPDLKLLQAEPVGRYGLNIVFSDGDRGGVLPWGLIGELAGRPGVDDFLHSAV